MGTAWIKARRSFREWGEKPVLDGKVGSVVKGLECHAEECRPVYFTFA